jgi:predicted amidohydrolase YtcJ
MADAEDAQMEIFKARRIIALASASTSGKTAEPEAFAVLGDRIVATGALDDLRARFPAATVTDFGDAVVVPGFNDSHLHPSSVATDILNLDVSSTAVKSLSELAGKVLDKTTTTAPGTWVKATRYDDGKMAEGRALTRWDLDEVAPDHPVLVVQVAGHWGVVNSKALELAGLDETSVAPAGGEYGRDGAGRLNGVLYERAQVEFNFPNGPYGAPRIPLPTLEDRLGGLQRALTMFHASGLTSLGDAHVRPRDLTLYQEAERRGLLSARVNMLISYEVFESFEKLGLRSGFGSDRLRVNGIKSFVDGAIGGRTCLLEEPFEDAEAHGIQVNSDENLAEIVRTVHNAGSRLGVHANGDRAISLLLDQIEAVNAANPRPDAHHRIEHCSIVTDEILDRMKRLGMIAVPFATYVHYHGGNLLRWYGTERAQRMFAHRSFLDLGVAVAGSSDYPCGPFEPLLAMQSCVTRKGWDGAEVGLSQRITPLEALELYTTAGAYASGEQDRKGRLATGFLADFVVLGADPTATPHDEIGAIPVQATYVGGQRVWST